MLTNAAVGFIADNASTLVTIANDWWARYLEKVNMLAPSVIEKVERDGAQRLSLRKYLSSTQSWTNRRALLRPFCDSRRRV